MARFIHILAFVFLALSITSLATSLPSLSVKASVDQTGYSYVVVMAQLTGFQNMPFSISVPGQMDMITVKDRSGLSLPYQSAFLNGRTYITATVPVDYLQFNLESNDFTTKVDSNWIYSFTINSSSDLANYSEQLNLPSQSTLTETNGQVQTQSDSLLIVWNDSSILPMDDYTNISATYQTIDQNDQTGLIIFGIVLMLVLIGAIVWKAKPVDSKKTSEIVIPKNHSLLVSEPNHQIMPSEPSPQMIPVSDKLDSHPVYLTLDVGEKEIIKEIKKLGGTTTQAQLNLNLHMPKVTLSRKLSSLENRGLIKKTQKGIRNLVSLTDIFEK